MDLRSIWDIYFAGICSIRFHPRNDANVSSPAKEVEWAADIADLMVLERSKRWDGFK